MEEWAPPLASTAWLELIERIELAARARTWRAQQMVGFDATQVPDAEPDALIAFLAHTAAR